MKEELTLDSTPTEIQEYLYKKGYRSNLQISKATGLSENLVEGILEGRKEMKDYAMYKFRNIPERIQRTNNALKSTTVSECGIRLNKILELTGHSIISLSKRIGVSKQELYSIRTGVKSKSSSDKPKIFTKGIATKINMAYPSLNPEWIVNGTYPILIDEPF